MKIVINDCYGGFDISEKALKRYNELAGRNIEYSDDIERHDPSLIKVVEELKEEANTDVSELKIIEIPEGISYQIEDYDGMEWVAEKHRTWR